MGEARGRIGRERGVSFGSGLAVGDAPSPGLAEAFGNLFEEGVVM